MENHDIVSSGGRGRGRGRGGGVPLLPSGLWDEIAGKTGDDDVPTESRETSNQLGGDMKGGADSFNAPDSMQFMSFGGRGLGRGRGRGRGRGDRSGPGFEKDAKGPDWECPSCTNVNWSWRTSCNRCSTLKPGAPITDEERDVSAQERVSASTVEIAEDGFDDFGRRAKGGRKDKTAKELAALARLQNNYGYLMNPQESDMSIFQEAQKGSSSRGQFEDADEPKLRESYDNSSKRDGGVRGATSNTSRRTDRDDRMPVRGADRHDDRRRSRSRDQERRGSGPDQYRSNRSDRDLTSRTDHDDGNRGARKGYREEGNRRSRSRDRDDRMRRSPERRVDDDRRRRDHRY